MRNWPTGPRTPRGWLLMLASFSMVIPLGLDIYVTALPAISAGLDVDTATTQLTMTAFLFGLGAGQFTGLLSDRIGRRPVILVGLSMVAVSMWLASASPAIGFLIVARAVSGIGSGAVVVCGNAIVRDRYTGLALTRTFTQIITIVAFSPIIGPPIGALVLRLLGWRGLIAALGVVAAVILLSTLRSYPETLARRIDESHWVSRLRSDGLALVRDREFLGYGMVLLFTTAGFFATQAASSFVLQDRFGFTPFQFGLVLGAGGLGVVIACQVSVRVAHRYTPRRLLICGLCFSVTGVLFILVSLAGLVVLLVAGLIILGTGTGLITPTTRALASGLHLERAGSAFAILGLSQYLLAGLAVPLTGLLPWSTFTAMAVVITCFTALAVSALALTSRTGSAVEQAT